MRSMADMARASTIACAARYGSGHETIVSIIVAVAYCEARNSTFSCGEMKQSAPLSEMSSIKPNHQGKRNHEMSSHQAGPCECASSIKCGSGPGPLWRKLACFVERGGVAYCICSMLLLRLVFCSLLSSRWPYNGGEANCEKL